MRGRTARRQLSDAAQLGCLDLDTRVDDGDLWPLSRWTASTNLITESVTRGVRHACQQSGHRYGARD
jgi:hypothetical protein